MSADLRRSMSLAHATSMVIGIILGASIFIQPSEITRLVPNARGLMLVWLAAGALTLCGALVCAELSSVFPDTGGVYVFLKRIFSPALGFLWGWGMFWSVHSGIIAAIAVILARYVAYFVPLGENAIRAVAIIAILGLSVINYLGVKPGSAVQLVLTAAKVGAIVVMVFLLFGFGGQAHRALPALTPASQPVSLEAYGLAIAAGLFAFGGWHMVTYAAGETRDPQRTIPRALVVVSALGALNGIILAGPRVYYAMAQDGLVFRWLGAVHPRRQTPYLAIAAQALCSCVLVATNSYRELFTRVVYTEWLFFTLLAAGLFVLRRNSQYKPAFLARGYPIVPLLFIVASLGIVLNQIRANPRNSAIGLGLLLLGLPVYFVWSHQRSKKATS